MIQFIEVTYIERWKALISYFAVYRGFSTPHQ